MFDKQELILLAIISFASYVTGYINGRWTITKATKGQEG